jgi:hypothetical protein
MEHRQSLGGGGSVSTLGSLDIADGSLTRSSIGSFIQKSKNTGDIVGNKKKLEIQNNLASLDAQLAEIRVKRSALARFDGRVHSPSKKHDLKKKVFSHPKLEYVYGEIMHSPYLTAPTENYPRSTYDMAESLKEFKKLGIPFKELPPDQRPYDENEMKKLFIKEVCNYNPRFNIPKSVSVS